MTLPSALWFSKATSFQVPIIEGGDCAQTASAIKEKANAARKYPL
jgi:hypothetical protein